MQRLLTFRMDLPAGLSRPNLQLGIVYRSQSDSDDRRILVITFMN